MPEQCKSCERYEKHLKALREGREHLWRRGELTDVADRKITADEQRVINEMEKHQVAQHRRAPDANVETPATDPHPNLEEEVRHRAYELYEQRGRQNGRDLDDWLQAEAEVTGTASKDTAA